MAGRQTFRILIVGKAGSGKSTLAKEIVRRMEGRYRKLVIVNRKREFAEFVEKGFSVGETGDPSPCLRATPGFTSTSLATTPAPSWMPSARRSCAGDRFC